MGKNICSTGKKNQQDSALMELEWAKEARSKSNRNKHGGDVSILNTMERSEHLNPSSPNKLNYEKLLWDE